MGSIITSFTFIVIHCITSVWTFFRSHTVFKANSFQSICFKKSWWYATKCLSLHVRWGVFIIIIIIGIQRNPIRAIRFSVKYDLRFQERSFNVELLLEVDLSLQVELQFDLKLLLEVTLLLEVEFLFDLEVIKSRISYSILNSISISKATFNFDDDSNHVD